jgi:phosphatidylglycerol:prolipoprotein diacylglycerol transferase
VFPILNVGPAAIQLPGLILLAGFWVSLQVAGRRAKKRGLSEDAVFNAGFVALSAGLVGARLGYVVLHWSAYQNDLSGILALTTGGLSVPAGLLAGSAGAALYLHRHRPPVAELLDVLAPAVALMLAFISFANLSSGAAYGQLSDVPWAIDLWGARRHPTQLYELLAALFTFGLLLKVESRRPYTGFLFGLLVAVYSGARLFLEAFRADPWVLADGYRATQAIGLGMLLAAMWWMSRHAVARAEG